MLKLLSLKHFAIVNELELNFSSGFSVLTGETGAGKSILLDALNMLLGSKAESTKIQQGSEEAILSAVFDIHGLTTLQNYLIEHGFESDQDELYIKRIVHISGKSRNFINGEPTTLAVLKVIGAFLIDIHGQNVHQSLISEASQRKILDNYAGNQDLLEKTLMAYNEWQESVQQLDEAMQKQHERQIEFEILEWKNKELSALNPQQDEWQQLSEKFDVMSNENDIKCVAETIENVINKDRGIQDQIVELQSQLRPFVHLEKIFQDGMEILISVESELAELASSMRLVSTRSDLDEQALLQHETRMSELTSAAKKYQVDVNDLPTAWSEIKERLSQLTTEQNISVLQANILEREQSFLEFSKQLSHSRKKAAEKLSQEVTTIMHELAMKNALFKVQLIASSATKYGLEQISFEVAMNLGSTLKPLNKVASGGELSRISLALQVIVSQYNHIPTLIFDEVDTGIGGKVADIVGKYLKILSKQHQILSVTHLPQVAVYGNQQFLVNKVDFENKTYSEVHLLDEQDRVEEIARMLGGDATTEIALKHAKELLKMAS